MSEIGILFSLFILTVYGFFVGFIAKLFHSGGPEGFWATIGIGISGSYIGGLITFLLGFGTFLQPSGIIFSIIGAIVFCMFYQKMRQVK